MRKIAIYTANVGHYDLLRQPYFPCRYNEEFDFICFSNISGRSHVGIWEIRKLDFHDDDNTRIARYVKLHPHVLLKDYDFTIWIDSNIEVIGTTLYERGLELVYKDVLISSLKHPFWNCAYKDGYNCVLNSKDRFTLIRKHLDFLKSEGYPQNNGLFETQILFRRNSSDVVQAINEDWWRIMCKYSKRDQLSINYLLHKYSVDVCYFLGDECARNHADFVYHSHTNDISMGLLVFIKKKLSRFLKRYRGKVLARFL